MENGDFEATIIQGKGGKKHYYKGMLSFVDIERKVHILWTTELIIGREEVCDIFLPDKRVSRKHAIVSLAYDGIRFSDLASSNGSTRNGEKVEGAIILNDGDELGIGGAFTMGVKIREQDEMVQSVVIGHDIDEYLLTQTEVLIGSDPAQVDIVLAGTEVASVHAQIEFIYDTPIITNMREDKPIIVDKQPVVSTRLKEYSSIHIGNSLTTWRL